MGPGVYPLNAVPLPPHPYDRCERVPVLRPPEHAHLPKFSGPRLLDVDQATVIPAGRGYLAHKVTKSAAARIRKDTARVLAETATHTAQAGLQALMAEVANAQTAQLFAFKAAQAAPSVAGGLAPAQATVVAPGSPTAAKQALKDYFAANLEASPAEAVAQVNALHPGANLTAKYAKDVKYKVKKALAAAIETPLPAVEVAEALVKADAAAAVAAPAAEALQADVVLGERLTGALGSNAKGYSGKWRGTDGVIRYVKEYAQPGQAYGEHLANDLYRSLGLGAPESAVVVTADGRTLYVSRWLESTKGTVEALGLTKEVADQALDGFVADVFLANRDAVGLTLDNLVVTTTGQVIRIDQGGALLYRAQGAKKTVASLKQIAEWDGLSDPQINAAYAKLFAKAEVPFAEAMQGKVIKQIDAIVALRDEVGGWEAWAQGVAPGLHKLEQKQIGKILETRTTALLAKRAEMLKANLATGYNANADAKAYLTHLAQKASGPLNVSDALDAVYAKYPDVTLSFGDVKAHLDVVFAQIAQAEGKFPLAGQAARQVKKVLPNASLETTAFEGFKAAQAIPETLEDALALKKKALLADLVDAAKANPQMSAHDVVKYAQATGTTLKVTLEEAKGVLHLAKGKKPGEILLAGMSEGSTAASLKSIGKAYGFEVTQAQAEALVAHYKQSKVYLTQLTLDTPNAGAVTILEKVKAKYPGVFIDDYEVGDALKEAKTLLGGGKLPASFGDVGVVYENLVAQGLTDAEAKGTIGKMIAAGPDGLNPSHMALLDKYASPKNTVAELVTFGKEGDYVTAAEAKAWLKSKGVNALDLEGQALEHASQYVSDAWTTGGGVSFAEVEAELAALYPEVPFTMEAYQAVLDAIPPKVTVLAENPAALASGYATDKAYLKALLAEADEVTLVGSTPAGWLDQVKAVFPDTTLTGKYVKDVKYKAKKALLAAKKAGKPPVVVKAPPPTPIGTPTTLPTPASAGVALDATSTAAYNYAVTLAEAESLDAAGVMAKTLGKYPKASLSFEQFDQAVAQGLAKKAAVAPAGALEAAVAPAAATGGAAGDLAALGEAANLFPAEALETLAALTVSQQEALAKLAVTLKKGRTAAQLAEARAALVTMGAEDDVVQVFLNSRIAGTGKAKALSAKRLYELGVVVDPDDLARMSHFARQELLEKIALALGPQDAGIGSPAALARQWIIDRGFNVDKMTHALVKAKTGKVVKAYKTMYGQAVEAVAGKPGPAPYKFATKTTPLPGSAMPYQVAQAEAEAFAADSAVTVDLYFQAGSTTTQALEAGTIDVAKAASPWAGEGFYLEAKPSFLKFPSSKYNAYKVKLKHPLVVQGGKPGLDYVAKKEVGAAWSSMTPAQKTAALRKSGYDGVVVLDEHGALAEVVAFDPKAVKLVKDATIPPPPKASISAHPGHGHTQFTNKDIETIPVQGGIGDPDGPATPKGSVRDAGATKRLDTEFPNPEASLTQPERAGIQQYTASGYATWNKQLRAGASLTSEQRATATAIRKQKRLTEDVIVYRGIGTEHPLNYLSVTDLRSAMGAVEVDGGFMSTSTSQATALGFADSRTRRVLEIHVPKGARGFWARKFGSHKGEHELLFAPGSKYIIREVRREAGGSGHPYLRIVVEMVV